jgi:transposase
VGPCKRERVRQVIERFDWSECGATIKNGEQRKLCAFVFVLGNSRMLFLRA